MLRPSIPAALLAFAVTLCAASAARADRAPLPGPCDYEEEGAPCKDGELAGTCAKEQCSRIAYRDGERVSAPYDCMKCRPAPADSEAHAPSDAAQEDAPGDATPAADAPASTPAPATNAAPPEPAAKSGMCAIAGDPASAGLLSLLLIGLGGGRRRRRRGGSAKSAAKRT
ncbi:MAG: MYXO-CTERM sorting domain-containing protein [Nannocystaceae bacterium]